MQAVPSEALQEAFIETIEQVQGERHQYLRLSIKVLEIETHDLYFSLQQQVSMPYPFPKTKCVRYMGAAADGMIV